MDAIGDALVESWDRQVQILNSLTGRIDESNRHLLPSADGWPIDEHLAHIHQVRRFWLGQVSKSDAEALGGVYVQEGEEWRAISDLAEIKRQLGLSAQAVRNALTTALEEGWTSAGPYTHPVMFLQHMMWHEGWHFGLILLALRIGGQEPAEAWEEEHVWGIWRTEPA